jgi:hypothetical protein
MAFHPNCSQNCEYQRTGKYGRDLTAEEWSQWAMILAQTYPDDIDAIPPEYLRNLTQALQVEIEGESSQMACKEQEVGVEEISRTMEVEPSFQWLSWGEEIDKLLDFDHSSTTNSGERLEDHASTPFISSNVSPKPSVGRRLFRAHFVEEIIHQTSADQCIKAHNYLPYPITNEEFDFFKSTFPNHIFMSNGVTHIYEFVCY